MRSVKCAAKRLCDRLGGFNKEVEGPNVIDAFLHPDDYQAVSG